MQSGCATFITPLWTTRRAASDARPRPLSKRRPGATMQSAPLSRRDVGRLALGVSAAALAAAIAGTAGVAPATAASKPRAPDFVTDETGVKYFDTKVGTGASPIEGDFVIIDYLAFLSNGKIFDNRKGFVFQVGQRQVIPGLETAVATMKPGGQRKVVVPAALGYGEKGVCVQGQEECLVPPGERLGFDITLQRVAIPPT